jgi:signal peptidase I
MGNSRNNSADSRVPGHGPVPVGNVIGKVQFIVLPVARFGGVEAIDPQKDAVGLGPATGGQPAPFALGLLGALPFAVGRARRVDDVAGFLPGRRSR